MQLMPRAREGPGESGLGASALLPVIRTVIIMLPTVFNGFQKDSYAMRCLAGIALTVLTLK